MTTLRLYVDAFEDKMELRQTENNDFNINNIFSQGNTMMALPSTTINHKKNIISNYSNSWDYDKSSL